MDHLSPVLCNMCIPRVQVCGECVCNTALPSLEVPNDRNRKTSTGDTFRWLFITLLFGTHLFKTRVIEKEEDDITRGKGGITCNVFTGLNWSAMLSFLLDPFSCISRACVKFINVSYALMRFGLHLVMRNFCSLL